MGVRLHGFRWDAGSSYMKGAAAGPDLIRAHLFSEHSSAYSLSGANIRKAISAYDFEDLPTDGDAARAAISNRIAIALGAGEKPLSLGGDHSISYPILRAIGDEYGPVNVLHIDAHPDLYDSFEGDPYSHACPFYNAIEGGSIQTLVQIGLRSVTPDARAYGEAHGTIMLGADELDKIPFEKLTAPLYVSIDLDGFDPAFAPGVAHPEPGGLSSREVISLLNGIKSPLVGADIVELNPDCDINLMTTHLAVRLVKELTAKLIGA